MSAPYLPETAPFTPEQRQWLNGFLAGMQFPPVASPALFSPPSGAGGNAGGATGAPVLILYGSPSGNAEGLAHTFAAKLKALAGGSALQPRVLGMDHFTEVDFSTEKQVLLLCSTWGEGDMPDNAAAFWEWLKSDKVPTLSHLSFAVLGL